MNKRKNSQPTEQMKVETGTHEANRTDKYERIKATFYLNPQDVIAIDQMLIEAFKKSGRKPERSHIVSEAIQYLFRQKSGQP